MRGKIERKSEKRRYEIQITPEIEMARGEAYKNEHNSGCFSKGKDKVRTRNMGEREGRRQYNRKRAIR